MFAALHRASSREGRPRFKIDTTVNSPVCALALHRNPPRAHKPVLEYGRVFVEQLLSAIDAKRYSVNFEIVPFNEPVFSVNTSRTSLIEQYRDVASDPSASGFFSAA